MSAQLEFWQVTHVDPEEVEEADKHAARIQAVVAFNEAYLLRYYRARLPAILDSRDMLRIRLVLDWMLMESIDIPTFYKGYPPYALRMVLDNWLEIQKWMQRFGSSEEYDELVSAQITILEAVIAENEDNSCH